MYLIYNLSQIYLDPIHKYRHSLVPFNRFRVLLTFLSIAVPPFHCNYTTALSNATAKYSIRFFVNASNEMVFEYKPALLWIKYLKDIRWSQSIQMFGFPMNDDCNATMWKCDSIFFHHYFGDDSDGDTTWKALPFSNLKENLVILQKCTKTLCRKLARNSKRLSRKVCHFLLSCSYCEISRKIVFSKNNKSILKLRTKIK